MEITKEGHTGAACGASSQITSGSGASVNSDGGYVGAFIHLQSLSVQLPNRHSSDEYRSKVYDIAFRAFSSSTMAPRSLTITNLLRTGVEDYSKSLGFQRFLGRLTHLSIDISDFDWTTNSPGTLLECWLGPAQASLESLTLTSTSWAPRFPANLKFSKLKKLELANVLFSMENPVQALILSDPIASNLEELTLNACVISLQGSNDKSTWADLFRAFQVTLTRLKKFTIRSTLSYIMIDGYSNQAPERTEAYPADAKAANMLWEGLGQEERMSSVRSYNESTVAYGILDYFDFDSFLLPHGFHMAHPTPFELVFGSQEQLEETIS